VASLTVAACILVRRAPVGLFPFFAGMSPVLCNLLTEASMTKRNELVSVCGQANDNGVTETLEIVSQFAREAARRFAGHLDPEDVAQEVAMQVLHKLRAGASFGADGRTRVYVNNAVYWMATQKWRKNKRNKAFLAANMDECAALTPADLSPGFDRLLASLPADRRELLFRVAMNDETVADVSVELAESRVRARGVEWSELDETTKHRETTMAYQTVYHRYGRVCNALREQLKNF